MFWGWGGPQPLGSTALVCKSEATWNGILIYSWQCSTNTWRPSPLKNAPTRVWDGTKCRPHVVHLTLDIENTLLYQHVLNTNYFLRCRRLVVVFSNCPDVFVNDFMASASSVWLTCMSHLKTWWSREAFRLVWRRKKHQCVISIRIRSVISIRFGNHRNRRTSINRSQHLYIEPNHTWGQWTWSLSHWTSSSVAM